MLSLHRTLSLRYLRRRLGRSTLVVLSIALGVATLVGTRALSQSMARAARTAAHPLAGVSDLLISNGELGVPRQLVRELQEAHVPGVQELHPLVLGRANLPDQDNRSVLVVGVDLDPAAQTDPGHNPWGLTLQTDPLHLPSWDAYPVFVGKQLAATLPADSWEFKVRIGSRVATLSRFGTVDAHGPAAALGGNVLYLRAGDAARLFGRPDLVTRIDVALAPGADRTQVAQRLQEAVGERARVQTPQASEDSVNDIMAGIELGFDLGGACALVVGLFLVYNALSVSVTERRHDIGILRSVGATRAQVAGLFTGEACLLGLLGSTLGVPLGWALAYLGLGSFQETLSDMAGVPLEMGAAPALGLDTVLVALLAGTATALLAALVPALSAAGEEPADAVRRAPRRGAGARLLYAAVGLLLGGGVTLILVRHRLPPRVGGFGAPVLLLLGLLAATPLLTALAARLLQPLARRVFSVGARLAADNLARSPGRTGLVIGALAAGVALIIETAGVTVSSEDAALSWIDRTLAADLFVTGFNPESPGTQNLTMDERIGLLLRSVPEVERAVPVHWKHISLGDQIIYLVTLDGAAWYDPARLPSHPLPGIELFPRLSEPGTVLVSENFAALHHVGPGDSLHLPGPHGPVDVRILGTVLDYSWNRGTVFMDHAQYQELFDDSQVDVYELYLRPGTDSAVVADDVRRRWGAEESLFVQTRTELRSTVRGMIRRMARIGYAQEVVVVVVAALGVLMALLISVLQRRRELGLLRAVGASQLQVLRSVLAEAALVGVVGSVLGVLFGIPLEWYAVQVILLDEAGFTFPVQVPWLQAGIVICLGMGVATLAGLLPALRAVRLNIAEAIAYE